MLTEEHRVMLETSNLAKKKGFRSRYHASQAQVQQWLRERYHIHIAISRGGKPSQWFYSWMIFNKKGEMNITDQQFTAYEYALEAAILEGLKLI